MYPQLRRYFEKYLPGLFQLLELKDLYLRDFDDDIPVSMVVELVKTLPALKRITFHCDTISVSEIMNILEYSENLTKLVIIIDEIDIDLSIYNSILALIKGCLPVIDENIFNGNLQGFKIVRI